MKAILMAAGVGSRLSRVVRKPKSVLDVGGMPLVRHTVEMLLKRDIEVAVVVGYEHEQVREALAGLAVTFYFNPFYKVTNSMASLWFARDFIDPAQDMILGNADVFWEENLLDKLMADQRAAVMLSDRSRVDVGDYFFRTEDGRIVAYGKDLTREERDCEYVGIAKMRADFLSRFRARVDQCVENELYNLWWENVLYEYSAKDPVFALDVDDCFWGEIDYIEDYQRILDHIGVSMSLEEMKK